MSLNFGDIITRAWQITWKQKALWGASFLAMLAVYLTFPLSFVPLFTIITERDPNRWFDNSLPWILMGVGLTATILFSLGIMPLVRAALTVGALKMERGAEKVSFREIFSVGRAFYLRLLGLTFLYTATVVLVNLAFSALQTIGVAVTMGLASFCMIPLMILFYPLLFAATAWMELTESAIVVEDLDILDASSRGWDVLRTNKINVLVIALIVYVGVGVATSLFMFPFILPLFLTPIFFMEGGGLPSWFFWAAGAWTLLFTVAVVFVQGIGMVFMKTTWLIAFLRMGVEPAEEVVVVTETNG